VTPPALAAGGVAALANVAGAALVTMRSRWSSAVLALLVALAAGFMLAVSLADLLPDAIRQGGERAAAVALGAYLLVYVVQHALPGHFHVGEQPGHVSRTVSRSAIAGLVLHTFFDGVAITSGFGVSAALGVLVLIAIGLHKVPEGIAAAGLVLAAGGTRGRAMGAAGILGVSTLLGVVATGITPVLAANGLALSAGVTLYVAASNLVPELQHEPGWRPVVACVAGSAIYLMARSMVGI
jgi:ZIP family zinc transporter/zinc and cadmium transporter